MEDFLSYEIGDDIMIRLMNNLEVNEVMDIWLNSTIKAHNFISEDYWKKNYNTVKNIYLPQGATYVYSEENKILAFISIINEELIGALFVDPDYQGQGIGRKLIEFVKIMYKKLSLKVYEKNYSAVKFYEKMGFKSIER